MEHNEWQDQLQSSLHHQNVLLLRLNIPQDFLEDAKEYIRSCNRCEIQSQPRELQTQFFFVTTENIVETTRLAPPPSQTINY